MTSIAHYLLHVLTLLLFGVGLFGFGHACWAQAVDPYAQAMKKVGELERADRHSDAAAALTAVAAQYPQDFAIQLRLAWLHFEAGQHVRAERSYREALELSPTSWEASLGLGWSLLRQGKKGAARPYFAAVLDALPDNASARQGVEASKEGPAFAFSPWGALTYTSYQDHPDLLWALSALVSLPVMIHQRLLLAASYRLGRFTIPRMGGGRGGMGGFMQHEMFFAAGALWPSVGIVGQYAYLYDASTQRDHAHLVGFSSRYSPWGDIGLAANLSLYDDLTIACVKSSYRLPIRPWLLFTPGFTLQVATSDDQSSPLLEEQSDVLFSGELGILLRGAHGGLWFGGRVGDVLRPADLDMLSIYNIDQRVAFSLHAGGRLFFDQHWALFAAYQLDHLEPLDNAQPAANLHLFTFGLAWRPGKGERK